MICPIPILSQEGGHRGCLVLSCELCTQHCSWHIVGAQQKGAGEMKEAVAGRHVGEGQPDQEQEAALEDIRSNPSL